MKLSEPASMLTDYALAGVCLFITKSLLSQNCPERPVKLWGLAFLVIALSAFTGGTWHGFTLVFGNQALMLMWKLTVYGVGVFNVLILSGSIMSTASRRACTWLLSLVWIKFMVYAVWMFKHDDFIFVVFDSAPTMVILLILHGYSYFTRKDTSSAWILLGIIVAGIAALVQTLNISPNADFNHNDLFHVIQIVSMVFLYRGGRKLKTHTRAM